MREFTPRKAVAASLTDPEIPWFSHVFADNRDSLSHDFATLLLEFGLNTQLLHSRPVLDKYFA
jgi:hypothetical protein